MRNQPAEQGWEREWAMEELNISISAVVTYVLITWIPWIVGIAVGGGLGALCGLGLRAFLSASPALRRPLVLLPWRTFVMGLLMVVWSPFIVSLLWIGPITGGVMVAGSVGLLALAFTTTVLVEHWCPSPLGARLIGGARTLAIASGLIAAGVGLVGGGGLGHIILDAARLVKYDLMWEGLLVVLALALGLDLLLGLVQIVAFQQIGRHGKPATSSASAA
jgi:hypothetical protein